MKLPVPRIRLQKLNGAGMAHYILPIVAVMLVGVIGTYMVVGSHANSPCAPAYVNNGDGKGCVSKVLSAPSLQNASGTTQRDIETIKARKQAAAKPIVKKPTKKDAERHSAAATTVTGAAATPPVASPPAQPQPDPPVTTKAVAAVVATPKLPTAKPEGDITVMTWEKVNGGMQRISSVKVHIARDGGNEACDYHKSNKAVTNSNDKDKKGNPVKGTIHFLGCTPGKYTVTADGRTGYKLLSAKTKDVTVNDDDIATAQFILEKIAKPVPTAAATKS